MGGLNCCNNDKILPVLICKCSTRGAGENEEHFEMCVRSLVEEIMFSGGPLLTAEVTATDSRGQTGHLESVLGMKRGRGFCHKRTKLYMSDSGKFQKKCKIPVMTRT